MKTRQKAPQGMDDYIARFPSDVRKTLQRVRMTIRKAAPGASETISSASPLD